MKSKFLESLEERLVFKTSHIFFHILVGVALLIIIGSVFILLWGITPSFKPVVDKKAYPPVAVITADEIARLLPASVSQGKATSKIVASSARREKKLQQKAKVLPPLETDSTKFIFEQTIDSMKVLIPNQKYLWANKGHYEQGYYKVRGNWRNGKHWVVDRYGILAKLNNTFRSVKAQSFSEKTSLLKAYIPILVRFDEKNRYRVLQNLLLASKSSVKNATKSIALLEKAVAIFPREKTSFLHKLVQFGKKNPRDGSAFIDYVIQVLPKFTKIQREKALDAMIAAYYKRYNNISRQKEATEMFMPLLSGFADKSQPAALAVFYKLYDRKNQNRRSTIEDIDRQYQYDLQKAENILLKKKMSKAGFRYKGLLGLGGGIVFIALVALILSLLSIQRNIRELKIISLK